MKKGFLVPAALLMAGILAMESCSKPDFRSPSRPAIASVNEPVRANALTGIASQTLVVTSLNIDGTLPGSGGLTGVAVDALGNTYISDSRNGCIRKITPAGVASILAGGAPPGPSTGPDGPPIDGPGNLARFSSPQGIAVDASGNVYVADAGFNKIRKVTPDGFVSTLAGSGPNFGSGSAGYRDGSPINAKFDLPSDVAVDASGNVYVADAGNQRIRLISGFSVSTLAGNGTSGFLDGAGTAAEFSFPTGITVDDSGNLYVVDASNRIRKITPGKVVSTLAGNGTAGFADGTGAAARFRQPSHLTADASGNIFVADAGNFRIPKITGDGTVSTFAGTGVSGSLDGAVATAQFAGPSGVAVDAFGNVFVSDGIQVRKIAPTSAGGVYTIAGTGMAGFLDGTGPVAQFNSPMGVTTDASGNVYIADATNQRIRMMTPSGIVNTFAGGAGGYRDGTIAAARFDGPTALAIDNSGNMYVADQLNQRIRKITAAGVVTTLAGNGTRGYVEGAGAGAEFRYPTGIAVDAAGTVFVADVENYCIRKITPAGVVSTLAGSGAPGFANGTGTAAQFAFPEGIALDGSGNIYVADKNNHRIREISPGGVVTTLAGTGKPGYVDGAASVAQFSSPIGISVDASGNLFVVDLGNQRVRKITPAGLVSTAAGSGTAGSSDGTYSQAQFNNPFGIAVDASGVIYVGDQGNNLIRKIQ